MGLHRGKAAPCQECRNRHVKCDGQKPKCQRCERSASICIWPKAHSVFRHGCHARYDADFADDQTWLTPGGHVNYEYVDETENIAQGYSQTCISSPSTSETSTKSATLPNSNSPDQLRIPPSETRILEYSPYISNFSLEGPSISPASPAIAHSTLSSSQSRAVAFSHAEDDAFSSNDETQACLMRYFVVHLAHWFDICDGEQHFATTVPLRARSCPPLLNAIYTASARHLSRNKTYCVGNQVQYGGKSLPNLTPETAIHYHNRCIDHFVSLADNSRDENLLAAAVILRFYEEVDIPFMGEDTESALHGIQVFLDTQAISAVAGVGLRHAAYWIALRQEIITAFSKQRAFRLPLGPCEPYRTLGPADDYVWADRLVIHCADVLQYCFGSERQTVSCGFGQFPISAANMNEMHSNRIAQYEELIAFESLWAELSPSSFKPIYSREADRSRGEVFPELWYLNSCHVAGLQHLELARILLAVYNPNLPRLGARQRTAMKSVDQTVRAAVLRLCGIALSNEHTPPGLVTACAAIGTCGDRFTDRVEQEALLDVLVRSEDRHAYPTLATQQLLKTAWEWMDQA